MEKKPKMMVWPYLKKYKWQYVGGILTLFLVDYINLYIPQFTGDITDGLVARTMDMTRALQLVAGILLCAVGLAVGRFLWRILIFGSARKIDYEIRSDMFAKLETLSMRYFNENKTGDLMAHFTNDLQAMRVAIGPAIISSFDAVVMTVMVVSKMMVYVDVKLTLLACIPMLFIAVGGYFFGEEFERRFGIKQKAFADLSDQVQESVSGARVIKAFVQEKQEAEAFRKINQENLNKNMDVVKLQAVVMPMLEVIIGISYVITIVYGGYLAINGTISLGRFVAFNTYLGTLVWPMIAMGDSITSFSQGLAAISRLNEIFHEVPDINEDMVDTSITELHGAIDFQHVNFSYSSEVGRAIRNLSFQIEKGTTLAILGRTGSGKTTIVNLLARLYDVDSGQILFDGHDIKTIPLKVLRENIAYVPQDNFLFSDTLKANIAFGKQDATLDEIIEATQAACVHDNIIDFPEGYDTMVGERGVTLSGGQKQRSSIARALLKDAPILILDDALSAVDTDTEEKILANLKELRKDQTTIMIAHRISTVVNADYLMVIENGAIVEYGTPKELYELDGIYRKMYEKQQLEHQLEME